jgi:hypothetical protein
MGKAKTKSTDNQAITQAKARQAGLVKRGRRIDEQAAYEMAGLVAKRITETGAAMILGINPQTWFNWKSLNSSKFSDLLTYVREAKLSATLDAIDEAGDGKVIETPDGPVVVARADWRAKAWMAERALAPERFAKQPEQTTQPTVNVLVTSELSRLVYGDAIEAQVVSDATERKAIASGDGG